MAKGATMNGRTFKEMKAAGLVPVKCAEIHVSLKKRKATMILLTEDRAAPPYPAMEFPFEMYELEGSCQSIGGEVAEAAMDTGVIDKATAIAIVDVDVLDNVN